MNRQGCLMVLATFAFVTAGCAEPMASGTSSHASDTTTREKTPIALPDPVKTILFEDPAGDAFEATSELAAENADKHLDTTCALFPEADPACSQMPPDGGRPRTGGIPARPALDLRAVEWTENPGNLTVTFVVESWDGDWDSLLPRPGSWVAYSLAWNSGENATCADGVELYFSKVGNGVQAIGGSGQMGPCRRVVYLPAGATSGTPARMEVAVPWDALLGHEAGSRLTGLRAATYAGEGDTSGAIVGFRGSLRPPKQYNLDLAGQLVDDVPVREEFMVQQGPVPSPATPLSQTSFTDVDPAPAVARRDAEIEAVALDATPQSLTINVTLTEVDQAPGDHQVYMQFDGQPNPQGYVTIYVLQSDVVNGNRTFNGYKLVAPDLHVEPFPFEGTVAPGAPGTISFRMDRNDMEPFQEGSILQRLAVQGNVGSARGSTEIAAGQGVSYIATAEIHDMALGFLVVAEGPAKGTDVERIQLEDSRADAKIPLDAPTMRNDGQSDVVRAELSVIAPDMARVVLALGDLNQVQVPNGYDALFDGVAIQTPEGTFTIGYRLDASGGPRFICGGDHTMFASTPADPLSGAVVDIAGRLLPGPSAGTVGIIVFDVPASCFGALDSDQDFRLAMTKVRAGAYLIRQSSSLLGPAGIELLDEMETSEPMALTFRTAPLPGPPTFWAKPFGLDNFYDLAGITFTAASSLLALGLLVRRRTRFRRYLRRIEGARAEADLEVRERDLAALRAQVHRDLVRNRLPTDHFAIVETRLNPLLSRTRVAHLAGRFPQLPDGLLARLEAFVADGVLSPNERARFISLAKGKIPSSQLSAIEKAIASWA